MSELLRIYHGDNQLPSLSSSTSGSMYVNTTTIESTNNIYDAKLYFDFDNTRYCIQGDKLVNAGTLQLYLGDPTKSDENTAGATKLVNDYRPADSGGLSWIIPFAKATVTNDNGTITKEGNVGLISLGSQTFLGEKTFEDSVIINNGLQINSNITLSQNETYNIGASNLRFNQIHAKEFHGALKGIADVANIAEQTRHVFSISKFRSTPAEQTEEEQTEFEKIASIQFDATQNVNINFRSFFEAGTKIPLDLIPPAAIERIRVYSDQNSAQTAIDNGQIDPGDLVHITTGAPQGVMYYVNENNTLTEFIAGVAAQAAQVAHNLRIQIRKQELWTDIGEEKPENENSDYKTTSLLTEDIIYNGASDIGLTIDRYLNEGYKIATIQNQEIYCGIPWETF